MEESDHVADESNSRTGRRKGGTGGKRILHDSLYLKDSLEDAREHNTEKFLAAEYTKALHQKYLRPLVRSLNLWNHGVGHSLSFVKGK